MKTRIKRIGILGIIFIVTVVIAAVLCACSKRPSKAQEVPVGDTSFTGYEFTQQTPVDGKVTYERLNMTNEYTSRHRIYGDGCQWEVSFECSKTGDLMLYGVDVAGMYRSLDHGETWETCNNGILNRGVGMFAIDPVNSKHVLAAGLGNRNRDGYGMWRSDDMCETWNSTQQLCIGGERYIWDGLEFDPTSSNGNICTDVYYSAPYMRDRTLRINAYELPPLYGEMNKAQAGLYKSVDGGTSFTQISSDERLSDGILKITDSGRVFIGNQHGMFEVDKSGNIVATLFENEISDYSETVERQIRGTDKTCQILKCNMGVTGLDCVGNVLYAQTWDGIYKINTDNGLNCENITEGGNYPDVWGQMVEVSPINPDRMIFMGRENYSAAVSCWVNPVWISEDGGKNWQKCRAVNASVFTTADWQGREKLFIMDPINEMRVLMFGSDTVMISDDGGKNFMQANGISNMMVGGKIHYNFYDPDLILYGAQDYTGTVSLDGGKTYKRLNIKIDGASYGNFYGAFASDCNTYYGFASPTWYPPYRLVITHDGGRTWTDTGLVSDSNRETYMFSSMQAYSDYNTLFAGPYVSHDFGYTWSRMKGCEMVYTGNPTGKREMYGACDGDVVVSYDAGRTWERVYDKPMYESDNLIDIRITGIAFDQVNRYVYALCFWKIWNPEHTVQWSDTFLYKIDVDAGECKRLAFANDRTMGWSVARDVAVDPNCTQVVYVGISGGYFSCPSGFVRSIDGGEMWKVLTNFDNGSFSYDRAENDGGHEVTALSVSPVDGRVTLGCGCYGFSTVDPPYDNSNLKNVIPEKHTIKYVVGGKVIAEKSLTNSRPAEELIYDEEGYTLVGWYDNAELTKLHDFSKGTFNSQCLYAKMKKSERVKFIVGGECIYECDIDEKELMFSRIPKPEREDYVFGGWFTDESLTKRADIYALSQSCSLYAGFYKDAQDVFDPEASDYADYIAYDDSMLHGMPLSPNTEIAENRCAYLELDKNATYLLTFTMDTRFRLGQTASWSFWPYNPITKWEGNDYYLDRDDTDGTTPIGKQVYYEIDTSKNNKILLYYWSITSPTDFLTVKNSIHIYKLLGDPVA